MNRKYLLVIVAVLCIANQALAQNIVYVNNNASGNNDGTSWTDAYTSLTDALNNASSNSQIWVTAGEYKPDPTDRFASFTWSVDSLELYGGFVGNETSISQRSYSFKTTLSGEIGDLSTANDNSYTVVSGPKGNRTYTITHSLMDGFKITRGNANRRSGGTENLRYGGGFLLDEYVASMQFYNCEFRLNGAISGSAITLRSKTIDAEVRMTNCMIIQNMSMTAPAIEARGFSSRSINLQLRNCLIAENEITDFYGNGTSGTAMYVGGQDGADCIVEFLNCTIANNFNSGTGVSNQIKSTIMFYNKNGAEQTIINMLNCIIWGNESDATIFGPNPTAGIPQPFTSIVTKGCILQDTLEVPNRTMEDVRIIDPEFELGNNNPHSFRIKETSPAREVGNMTNSNDWLPTLDIAGNPRVDGQLDIGCYEFQRKASIQSVERNILSVYPNPATNTLSIAAKNHTVQVKIYNTLGAEVLASSHTQNIDISKLPAGIYTVSIEQNKKLSYAKFIKQ